MSEHTPERPAMDDELVQAYARAQALAQGAAGAGDGPSPAVRASVLAAAQALAAEAASRRAPLAGAPAPLAPVAPPVADVGRGRPRALNLASWRVRAGAGLCAAALVAVAGWRLDALRRDEGAVQVASATGPVQARIVPDAAPLPPPPKELSAPPAAVQVPAPSEARRAAGDKDLVVAQADQPYRAQGALRSRSAERAVRRDAAPADAAQADEAPVVVAAAPPPPAPDMAVQPPAATLNSTAAPRAAAPAPSTRIERLAAARTEPSAPLAPVAQARLSGTAVAVDAAAKASPSAAGASPPAALAPLQAAAEQGDVQALKTLLADPAVRVDAPDADGRTALLHAVLAQRPDAVRLLLAAGADPGRADHAGLTPRQAARSGASAEVAALLAAPR